MLSGSLVSKISSSEALKAIDLKNSQHPIALAYNPYSMRQKMSYPFHSYPQTIAAFPIPTGRLGVGPLVVRSLGMLSPFAAFADDGSGSDTIPADNSGDTGGQSWTGSTQPNNQSSGSGSSSSGFNLGGLLNSIPSLVSDANSIMGLVNGPPGTNIGNVPPRATYVQPSAAPPVNWMPIVIGAGVLLAITVLMKKK